jgi:site-specific DNA-methyltransferase (adenine-specific)
VLAHGTGALNIDGCRIEHGGNIANADGGGQGAGYEAHNKPARIYGKGLGGIVAEPHTSGRWPANVVLDEHTAAIVDEQSGVSTSGAAGLKGSSGFADGYSGEYSVPYGDTGGASRFFYAAKAPSEERPTGNGTAHPTVKPLDLMRWLVRLVTPPGGIVLEPFAGSGTTVEACIKEDVRCVAIEREADYLPLIDERINRNNLSLFAGGEA